LLISGSAGERSLLGLKSAWNFAGGRREFLGYECTAAFAVQSGDLDDVQQLLVDLVGAGANEIEGVDFDVAGKPAMRAEAHRKAVSAARDKAVLYAESARVRLGPVVHIDDVDPESTRAERYRGHGYAGEEASAEDLAPGHVVVSAAVIVGFSHSRLPRHRRRQFLVRLTPRDADHCNSLACRSRPYALSAAPSLTGRPRRAARTA